MNAANSQVKIKFCGIRRPEDILLVNQHRPDYIGLIFAAGKRQVTPEQASDLIANLDAGIRTVGVFVDEAPQTIARLAIRLGLDVVQLHGNESLEVWQELRTLLPGTTAIWQKLGIPLNASLARSRVSDYRQMLQALQTDPANAKILPDLWLLDTEYQGQTGGTGQTFPWQLLQKFAADFPVVCAGGLNPDNVAAAIAVLHPAIVDCSSGIERSLEKQADLMASFIQAVRNEPIH